MVFPAPVVTIGSRLDDIWTARVPVDVLFVIIEHSDFLVLLSWRATCSTFFAAVSRELRVRYEASVIPFVSDVKTFNDILRDYGGVISGSVALKFFLPFEPWAPGDLDLYIPDHTYDGFVAAAVSRLHFAMPVNQHPVSRPSGLQGVASVKELRRFQTTSARFVDIIRSTDNSPLTPLRGFWCTLVKNFVTPCGAGCSYPDDTFSHRGRVKEDPLSPRDISAVAKYAYRGFQLVQEDVEDLARRERAGAFGQEASIVISFGHAIGQRDNTLPVTLTRDGWMSIACFPARQCATKSNTTADSADEDL